MHQWCRTSETITPLQCILDCDQEGSWVVGLLRFTILSNMIESSSRFAPTIRLYIRPNCFLYWLDTSVLFYGPILIPITIFCGLTVWLTDWLRTLHWTFECEVAGSPLSFSKEFGLFGYQNFMFFSRISMSYYQLRSSQLHGDTVQVSVVLRGFHVINENTICAPSWSLTFAAKQLTRSFWIRVTFFRFLEFLLRPGLTYHWTQRRVSKGSHHDKS